MSGRKSKDKGSAAERELCKLLGGIFNGPFIRSANSGAFVGGKNASRKANLSENQIDQARVFSRSLLLNFQRR